MNEREIFGVVLLRLVQKRCLSVKASSASRTSLQAEVPVPERPLVRRGFDALVEHGALELSGEQIALTATGQLLLDDHFADEEMAGWLPNSAQRNATLHLLSAIRQDARLSHSSVEAAINLPGRLETSRTSVPGPARRQWWIVLAICLMAMLAYVSTST